MDLEDLDYVLESLLLVSGNGISVDEITETLGLQRSEVGDSIRRLKKKYSGKRGILLLSYSNKIQFASNPKYAESVESVLRPVREKELSSAALETVAIVAYRQPVTRLEIEQVRGVNSDYAIQVLQKHNLIEIKGRKDAVGKPLLFGTTDNFLKRFRIEDINQLPDYEKLLESITVIEESGRAQAASIYNEFEIPPEQVPEFLDGEENIEKIE